MALYRHAVEQRYRFFSYGDAMLLARQALNLAHECCNSNSSPPKATPAAAA